LDFIAVIVEHELDEPVASLRMRSDAAMYHEKDLRRRY
jgi:hypothetical protein